MRLAISGLILTLALLALAPAAQAQDPSTICLDATASRYIGETEKNLGRAFRLAEQTDVVLQFDEADALFGRRTQTRDAHDRYANQEVSYLLQRIERFRDVQVLSSNGRRTLVAGFGRRARNAGLVVVETERGARVIEFSSAERARALEYAQVTLEACPPD